MNSTTPEQTQVPEKDLAHKEASKAAVSIAGCAFAAFVFGAIFQAPWPGAVAACGISVMGVGVAHCMLRRN